MSILLDHYSTNPSSLESYSNDEEFTDESIEEMKSRLERNLVSEKNKEISKKDKQLEDSKNKKQASKIAKWISWGIVIIIVVVAQFVIFYNFFSWITRTFMEIALAIYIKNSKTII